MVYLQYPGPLTSEGVASMDDVPVLGEARQHVLHTLLECVHLNTLRQSQPRRHLSNSLKKTFPLQLIIKLVIEGSISISNLK